MVEADRAARVAWAYWLLRRECGFAKPGGRGGKPCEARILEDYMRTRERASFRSVIGPDARRLVLYNLVLSNGDSEFFEAAMGMFDRVVGRRELRRTWFRKLALAEPLRSKG